MTTKQQEEMSKRFNKKFPYASFCWNGDNATGLKFAKATKRKVKSHLQSEVDLAVAERDKDIVEMITNRLRARMTDPLVLKNEIKTYEDIISLITNNPTK